MGAMIGVNELGIQIPQQLSLIGFDNLQFARACNPKLTIVSQPTDGIAREVARIMLEHLENGKQEGKESFSEKLRTEIIEGKSVSFLNGKLREWSEQQQLEQTAGMWQQFIEGIATVYR